MRRGSRSFATWRTSRISLTGRRSSPGTEVRGREGQGGQRPRRVLLLDRGRSGDGVIDMYAGPTEEELAVFPTRVVGLPGGKVAYSFTMFQVPACRTSSSSPSTRHCSGSSTTSVTGSRDRRPRVSSRQGDAPVERAPRRALRGHRPLGDPSLVRLGARAALRRRRSPDGRLARRARLSKQTMTERAPARGRGARRAARGSGRRASLSYLPQRGARSSSRQPSSSTKLDRLSADRSARSGRLS